VVRRNGLVVRFKRSSVTTHNASQTLSRVLSP